MRLRRGDAEEEEEEKEGTFVQTVPKVQACNAAHSMGGRLTTGIYHATLPWAGAAS